MVYFATHGFIVAGIGLHRFFHRFIVHGKYLENKLQAMFSSSYPLYIAQMSNMHYLISAVQSERSSLFS